MQRNSSPNCVGELSDEQQEEVNVGAPIDHDYVGADGEYAKNRAKRRGPPHGKDGEANQPWRWSKYERSPGETGISGCHLSNHGPPRYDDETGERLGQCEVSRLDAAEPRDTHATNQAEYDQPEMQYVATKNGVSATHVGMSDRDANGNNIDDETNEKFARLGRYNRGTDNYFYREDGKTKPLAADSANRVDWSRQKWYDSVETLLRQLPINKQQRELILENVRNESYRAYSRHYEGRYGAVVGFIGLVCGAQHPAISHPKLDEWLSKNDAADLKKCGCVSMTIDRYSDR